MSIVISFKEEQLKYIGCNYKKIDSGEYHYFKKKEKEEGEEEIIVRVKKGKLILKFYKGWVIDNRFDIKEIQGIEKNTLIDFYNILFRLKKCSQENVIFEDYPMLIKYLSIIRKYNLPLLNIEVKYFDKIVNREKSVKI